MSYGVHRSRLFRSDAGERRLLNSIAGNSGRVDPNGPGAMNIKIFADGADLPDMRALSAHPLVKGFTTNPTLMRKAGVADYRGFARQVLEVIPDRPVSFEVFSDDFCEMERQALEIASWG